jgi:predicted RNA-binding protein with PUA domain
MDGKHYDFRYTYLPLPLIKDVKEGDTMDLEFEVQTRNDEDEVLTREMIKLHITFDQRSYRYRSFGNFEDVVRKVV